MTKGRSVLLWAVCALLVLTGCGLPRVVILKDPLTPEEHINLGVAYEKEGELDAAIREYEAAAGKLPLGHLYLGNAHFLRGDLDKAEKHYRKAVRKLPENADAHNNLAWLYYTRREHLDKAESLALRAIELNPAKEEVYRDTLQKIRALGEAHR